jgi:4'-phosphopantetheinyl transferase
LGLLYIKPFFDTGTIGLWDTSDLKTEQEPEPGFPLTPEEQQHLKTIKSNRRKTEWLSVRLLFDAMRAGKDWHIAYLESGKPYLANSNCSISISHSGKYTAIVIAPNGRAGIDIQCFNPSIMNAPDYFLTEKELATIGEENKFINYHLYWCAKETLYKCFSEFSPDMKNDIYILKKPDDNIKGVITCNGRTHEAEIWAEQTEEYVLAVSVIRELQTAG